MHASARIRPASRLPAWLIALAVLAACSSGEGAGTSEQAEVPAAPGGTPPSQSSDSDPAERSDRPASPSQEPASPEEPDEPEEPEVLLEPSEPFSITTATLRAPDGEAHMLSVFDAPDSPRRSRGLMGREDLPDGTGMVFRFPRDSSGAFYMYRTLMPLSIAFFDAQGVVVAVLDMEPCTADDADDCELYGPDTAYRGALEVEQGFFNEVGLVEGWKIELPPDLPAPS